MVADFPLQFAGRFAKREGNILRIEVGMLVCIGAKIRQLKCNSLTGCGRSLLSIHPVLRSVDLYSQRDFEFNGGFHDGLNLVVQRLPFFWGHFKDKFVVYLQQQLRLVRLQELVQTDHGDLDDIGAGALNGGVGGGAELGGIVASQTQVIQVDRGWIAIAQFPQEVAGEIYEPPATKDSFDVAPRDRALLDPLQIVENFGIALVKPFNK